VLKDHLAHQGRQGLQAPLVRMAHLANQGRREMMVQMVLAVTVAMTEHTECQGNLGHKGRTALWVLRAQRENQVRLDPTACQGRREIQESVSRGRLVQKASKECEAHLARRVHKVMPVRKVKKDMLAQMEQRVMMAHAAHQAPWAHMGHKVSLVRKAIKECEDLQVREARRAHKGTRVMKGGKGRQVMLDLAGKMGRRAQRVMWGM